MNGKLVSFLLVISVVSLLFVSGCAGRDDSLSAPPPLPDEDVEDSGDDSQIPALPSGEGESLPPIPIGEDDAGLPG